MILRFVLSDPAKSSLESGEWIDGYDYQNKDTHKKTLRKNKSVIFSVQCIITKPMRLHNPHPAFSDILDVITNILQH